MVKTEISLKKNKTEKISATVNKVSKKKTLIPKSHAPKLRYISSDKNIATVSSKGVIKAKKAGKCKIYVYTVNGARASITVKVQD